MDLFLYRSAQVLGAAVRAVGGSAIHAEPCGGRGDEGAAARVHALALADRDVVEQVPPGEGRAGEVAAPCVAQDAGVVAVGVAVGPDLVHEVAPLGRAVADGDGEAEGDGRERQPAGCRYLAMVFQGLDLAAFLNLQNKASSDPFASRIQLILYYGTLHAAYVHP